MCAAAVQGARDRTEPIDHGLPEHVSPGMMTVIMWQKKRRKDEISPEGRTGSILQIMREQTQ